MENWLKALYRVYHSVAPQVYTRGSLCIYIRRKSDWQASTGAREYNVPFVLCPIFARQRAEHSRSTSPGNDLASIQHRIPCTQRTFLGMYIVRTSSSLSFQTATDDEVGYRKFVPHVIHAWRREKERSTGISSDSKFTTICRRITNFSKVFEILQSARN